MEMFLTAAGKRIYRAPEFNRDVDLTTHVEQRTAPGERMQFADSMAERGGFEPSGAVHLYFAFVRPRSGWVFRVVFDRQLGRDESRLIAITAELR